MQKKGVGLHVLDYIHHVDHLGVLCIGLGQPLLFTDERQLELCKKYYPKLDARFVDHGYATFENIAPAYDCVFNTNFGGKMWVQEQEALFPHIAKKMRSVYCPHGNSDKGQNYIWMEHFADEDIVLLYGQRMVDFLKEKQVLHHIHHPVMTGNYRHLYFKQNRSYYEKLMNEVLSQFPKKQPTILYAPTWNPDESSFFEGVGYVLDHLPSCYNLIFKPHPFLEQKNLGRMIYLEEKYKEQKNLIWLKEFPLIYPLLDKIDLYIGDVSSVGYDLLAFNKPMFFLSPQIDQNAPQDYYLFRCGTVISPSQYDQIYSMIEKHLPEDANQFSAIRKEIYDYTFGKERAFEEIKADIFSYLS